MVFFLFIQKKASNLFEQLPVQSLSNVSDSFSFTYKNSISILLLQTRPHFCLVILDNRNIHAKGVNERDTLTLVITVYKNDRMIVIATPKTHDISTFCLNELQIVK